MANTFLTPSIIANEALMVLLANLTSAGLVHRDYSNEFVKVGDTITVRKPAKFTAYNFTGTTSNQNVTEGSVDVKMDRFRDITASVSSKEMTLDIKNFSKQIIEPAMQAMAQAIDSDIIALGIEKAGTSITGTSSSLVDLSTLSKNFDLAKVPNQNRNGILHPTHKYRYITTDTLAKVAYAGESTALRDSALSRVYGTDLFMSQNCPDAPATTGTATAYKITATKGASVVALTAMSAATATIKTGDSFIIGGYRYTFTANETGSSSAIAEIAIDQPIHADFTAVDALPIKAPNSLGFHRNGIALVTRSLEIPMGSKNAYIASYDGLSIRVVFDYNSSTKTDTVSFDTIYGIKELDTTMIQKIVN